MNEPRGFADVFCEVSREGDYVVVGGFFDLIDALNRKTCARLDLLKRIPWNRSHLCVDFADSDLDFQPFLEFALFAPERAHLRKCVTFDHKNLIRRLRRLSKQGKSDGTGCWSQKNS